MAEKWAIVTGGSAGIGLEFAKQLADRGYHLVLVARSREKLEEIQKELATDQRQVRIVALDLAKVGSCEALVKHTDQWKIVPEVLINNAGVGTHGPFLESSLDDVRAMIDLNTSALVLLSHLYGRKMREAGIGYMLQVASTAAFQPLPAYAVYGATKSLVLSFSQALNYEVKAFGISSTVLCPGPTSTGFFSKTGHKINRSIAALMMQPEEVARQGIEAMFKRDEVHIAGLMNKLTANLPRLLPANFVVRGAALINR